MAKSNGSNGARQSADMGAVKARFVTPQDGSTIVERFPVAANTVLVPAGHVAWAPYEMPATPDRDTMVEMHYMLAASRIKKSEDDMPKNLVEAVEQLNRDVNPRDKRVLLTFAAQRIISALFAKQGVDTSTMNAEDQAIFDKHVTRLLTDPANADKAQARVIREMDAILSETRTPQKRKGGATAAVAKLSADPDFFADLSE